MNDLFWWAFEGVDGHWTRRLREYQQGHLCRLLSRWKKRRCCGAFCPGFSTRISVGSMCDGISISPKKLRCLFEKMWGWRSESFLKRETRGWCHFFFGREMVPCLVFFVPGQPMSVTGLPRIFWGPFKMGFPFQVFSTGRIHHRDVRYENTYKACHSQVENSPWKTVYFFFHRDGGILH